MNVATRLIRSADTLEAHGMQQFALPQQDLFQDPAQDLARDLANDLAKGLATNFTQGLAQDLAQRLVARAAQLEDELQRTRAALEVIASAARAAEEAQLRVVAGLQHRMKNILAVVRSISSRTLEMTDSIEVYASHFAGRLNALARVQSVLARVPGGVDLEDLIRDELAASLAREGEQVEIGGPRVILKEKAVEVLAMALHELTINALKFGALSRPEGRLSIHWRPVGAFLQLDWWEQGVAVLNINPARVGFGRDLLERGLHYDLAANATLDFAPGGARCTIELPLGERIAIAEDDQ